MTRNGKIARLPYGIREELNRRMRDGQFGPALLNWLNEHPDCQDILEAEFEGRPITKQNLSEWRQGGYEDWERKEEARQRVQTMVEKAGDLENDAGGMTIADRLGTLLAAELAVAMEQLDKIEDPKERWARLKEITREVYRLRREDHDARKLRMAEQQYERREKEDEKERLVNLGKAMQDKPLVTLIQEGKWETWKWADWEIRVGHDLPMPDWWTNPETSEEWSKLMMPYWRETNAKKGDKEASPKSKAKGRGHKAPSVQAPSVQRNSQDQVPRAGSSSKFEVQGSKSKVRPGRTKSDQKSEPVAPGPNESKSGTKESTEGVDESPQSTVGNGASPSSSAKASSFAKPTEGTEDKKSDSEDEKSGPEGEKSGLDGEN